MFYLSREDSHFLQVVSDSKFVSVGIQSPTERNAPRGCTVILFIIVSLQFSKKFYYSGYREEAQKEEPGKYYILNRAIFYIGRIVSSQKGRDFVKSEYNKMKRVYSIWLCMNMKENSLTQIYLTKKNIIGSHDWKGDLELLNIIMIGIAENLPEKEENYELHRLLSALLSSSLEAEEKLDIIEKEYDIPIEDDIREEVEEMCNLSQGIKEKAFEGGYLMGQEEGRESGYAEGKQNGYAEAVCLMYESGISIEQIAGIIKMSADKVNELVNPDLMD